jgi:hypothetical protein
MSRPALIVAVGVAAAPAQYRARWYRFDNETRTTTAIGDATGSSPEFVAPASLLPTENTVVRVDVSAIDSRYASWAVPVSAYFCRRADRWLQDQCGETTCGCRLIGPVLGETTPGIGDRQAECRPVYAQVDVGRLLIRVAHRACQRMVSRSQLTTPSGRSARLSDRFHRRSTR